MSIFTEVSEPQKPVPKTKLKKHYGPGAHPGGTSQDGHAGGTASHKRKSVKAKVKETLKWKAKDGKEAKVKVYQQSKYKGSRKKRSRHTVSYFTAKRAEIAKQLKARE